MARRSIGFSLALGIVLLLLVIVLGVGWQVLVWKPELRDLEWTFFVLGIVISVLMGAGLVWLWLWLMREINVNQSQRAFLDAVTHEMKTPLASMRLYLETFQRHDLQPERLREFVDHMHGDLERLDQTVQQVLTAARAEGSARKAKLGRVRLDEVLSACIDDVRSAHHLPETAVQLEIGPAAAVKGDAGELSLVFRNLLENAVRYSDEPVEVKVRVRGEVDGRVNVEITDQGIGIPSGELNKIFQRFYRVGRDVQRTAAGLGLGLFIVRNLVRRQGGRVEARSEGAGHGSRFVVTLKAAT